MAGGFTVPPVNERVIEVPFAVSCLRGDEKRILDVGCAEVGYHYLFPAEKIFGVDVRPHDCDIKHHIEDVRHMTFTPGSFDLVLCISTLDHIGYAAYGQGRFENGPRDAMLEMKRMLSDGGRLVVTFPYGKSGEYPFVAGTQKVFGADEWAELKAGWKVNKELFFWWNGVRYRKCEAGALVDLEYGGIRALGVLCAELEKE